MQGGGGGGGLSCAPKWGWEGRAAILNIVNVDNPHNEGYFKSL